jgi:hypothetical protein
MYKFIQNTTLYQRRFILISIVAIILALFAVIILLLINNSSINTMPISYAVSVPNNILTSQEEIKVLNYTSSEMPDFKLNYYSDWNLKVKEFAKSPTEEVSRDFPDCNWKCMQLRFGKENISLDIILYKTVDDNGQMCSNKAEYKILSNGWIRIKDSEGYLYTKSYYLNETITHKDYAPESINNEWFGSTDKKGYKLCTLGSGFFTAKPLDNISVLILNPKVKGNLDSKTLEELDFIVTSINI